MDQLDNLISAAFSVQANAYAPYSVYSVGAAIKGADGKIYTGCNVENVSFGLTICAERVAIGNMVSAGCREIEEIVIVTKDGGSPCGMCRQTMIEFTNHPERVKVWLVNDEGARECHSLAELIPNSFRSDFGGEK